MLDRFDSVRILFLLSLGVGAEQELRETTLFGEEVSMIELGFSEDWLNLTRAPRDI